jgi:hypothetical protein
LAAAVVAVEAREAAAARLADERDGSIVDDWDAGASCS